MPYSRTRSKKSNPKAEKKKVHLKSKSDVILSMKFDIKAEFLSFFDFRTEYSKDFKIDTVKILENTVDRKKAKDDIIKYVNHFLIAEQIERGIFESTLITVTKDKILPQLSTNLYEDKLIDICKNLDVNNKHIDNQTLLPSVSHYRIDPFYIAFLSPSQLHPVRWADELKKKADKMMTHENIPTTDLYKCYKCGNRKSKVSQMQTRGADEPMTIFVTCVVCYNTFTK